MFPVAVAHQLSHLVAEYRVEYVRFLQFDGNIYQVKQDFTCPVFFKMQPGSRRPAG